MRDPRCSFSSLFSDAKGSLLPFCPGAGEAEEEDRTSINLTMSDGRGKRRRNTV